MIKGYVSYLPDNDPPVVVTRGKDISKPRVSPGHSPHGALVTSEVSRQRLGPVTDVKYLDATVAGASRQPGPVEVHLGVVDHVLVAGVHS